MAATVAPSKLLPSLSDSTSLNSKSSPQDAFKSSNPVGIIFPPADLRGIIDKTAQFVAKNGVEFENRLLQEQGQQKFSFLFPNNPYRAYFELKVKESKTGVEEVKKPEIPQAILDLNKKEEEKQQRKQQLFALTQYSDAEKDLKAPDPDNYTVSQPFLSPVDVDIVKTTAQFVARNGQRFLTGLTQREKTNPQFDFLKPTHAAFSFFTNLVEAYTKCLLPPPSQIDKLKEFVGDHLKILHHCNSRRMWEAEEERKRKALEDAQAEERAVMSAIDWHDFIVVETIDFTAEDETLSLTAPIDFSSSQPRRLPTPLDALPTTYAADLSAYGDGDEDEMEVDDDQMDVDFASELKKEDKDEGKALAPPPLPDSKPPPIPHEGKEPLSAQDFELLSPPPPLPSEEEEAAVGGLSAGSPYAQDEEKINIVAGYQRVPKKRPGSSSVMQKCPVTGLFIPANEMTNHLNRLLLDPRWKDELEKQKEKARKQSAYATSQDVGSYLSAFATKRPDMFGSVEEEIMEHADPLGVEIPAPPGTYDPSRGSNTFGATSGGGGIGAPPPPPPAYHAPSPGFGGPTFKPAASNQVSDMSGEPSAKRHLNGIEGKIFVSETQFINLHPDFVKYNVKCAPTEGFSGTNLQLQAKVSTTCYKLKELIASTAYQHRVSANSLTLINSQKGEILQDSLTLAYYNLGPLTSLEVSFKNIKG